MKRTRTKVPARVQTALMVVALLTAGALIGSFLLEWRGARLRSPGSEAEYEGLPASLSLDELEGRISVEVLNGAGDAGAAALVTEELRRMGFDVKTFGNAPSFDQQRSSVLDRSGRTGAARAVADSLGVVEVVSRPRADLYLDATVILGRDWRSLIGPGRGSSR